MSRVEQELAEMREARDVLREQRDELAVSLSSARDRVAQLERLAATAIMRETADVVAELASARAELEQHRQSGWCVARDLIWCCTACGREISRGQAYAVNTVRGQLAHVHCPEVKA